MKVDNLSRELICAGSDIKVDGVEKVNAREEKLVVMPEGLTRIFESEDMRWTCHENAGDFQTISTSQNSLTCR